MKFKIGDRVYVHGHVDEIRKDTVIIRNEGGYFGTIPSEIVNGKFIHCEDCKNAQKLLFQSRKAWEMSGDVCTDNRFEMIEKYKQKLIEATNIETSADEMAVLDSILFRFWQMGWLDRLEQPEIIQCFECQHWTKTVGDERWSLGDCDSFERRLVMCKGFCAWAERREG